MLHHSLSEVQLVSARFVFLGGELGCGKVKEKKRVDTEEEKTEFVMGLTFALANTMQIKYCYICYSIFSERGKEMEAHCRSYSSCCNLWQI